MAARLHIAVLLLSLLLSAGCSSAAAARRPARRLAQAYNRSFVMLQSQATTAAEIARVAAAGGPMMAVLSATNTGGTMARQASDRSLESAAFDINKPQGWRPVTTEDDEVKRLRRP